MRPARPTPWSILQTTPGDLEPVPKVTWERGRAVPDLPELGARNANSFGEVAALPRASSSRPVCSVGFLVASGTRLCKNGGSWGAAEKACAAALRGLWLQLLTQALFFHNSTVDLVGGFVLRALTPQSKRRLGAASAVARLVAQLWARRTRSREQRTLHELSAPVLKLARPQQLLQRAWRRSERVLARCALPRGSNDYVHGSPLTPRRRRAWAP